jgi:hypothetical protein
VRCSKAILSARQGGGKRRDPSAIGTTQPGGCELPYERAPTDHLIKAIPSEAKPTLRAIGATNLAACCQRVDVRLSGRTGSRQTNRVRSHTLISTSLVPLGASPPGWHPDHFSMNSLRSSANSLRSSAPPACPWCADARCRCHAEEYRRSW